MWELIVVWEDGTTSFYKYDSEDEAEQGGVNMRMALGNQIAWHGVRKLIHF